jgi:hypothetical protein
MKPLIFFVALALLLVKNDAGFAQSWEDVQDTTARVYFALPVVPQTSDTLHTTMYVGAVDSLLSLQVHVFDSAYFDAEETLWQAALENNKQDTLRAIAQLAMLAAHGELLSIDDIKTPDGLRTGLEIGMGYLTLQSDEPTLIFMRYFLFQGKFIVFSIAGSEKDLTRLTAYKNTFFNTIKFY